MLGRPGDRRDTWPFKELSKEKIMCQMRRVTVTTLALLIGLTACAGSTNHALSGPRSLPPIVYTPPPLPHGVLTAVPVSGGPLRMAAGFGSLWVSTHRGPLLYRIDPATNKVVARIVTGTESCGTPAIGFGRVWVSGCDPGPLVSVDASTNKVVARSKIETSLVMGVAAGKLWAGDPIDPTTLDRTAHLPVQGADVVSGAGSLWVVDTGSGLVKRVDPWTDTVTESYRAGEIGGLENFGVFADGALWVYSGGDRLWRIDPHRNRVAVHHLRGIGRHADATFTVGDGGVWVRPYDHNLYRFDVDSLSTRRIYPAHGGGFVTVAFGSVWESNLEESNVWRVRE
jgi:streptogramin lyase